MANRDLKLENLLLDRDGRDGTRPLLKICDFGYSKHEDNSSAKTGVGTPVYMAPEVILGDNKYNAKVTGVSIHNTMCCMRGKASHKYVLHYSAAILKHQVDALTCIDKLYCPFKQGLRQQNQGREPTLNTCSKSILLSQCWCLVSCAAGGHLVLRRDLVRNAVRQVPL